MEIAAKEIIELLLVAIFGVMIAVFVIGGGGHLGEVWDAFCEKWPQFCEGGDTSTEYNLSTDSARALTAAINAIITGDKEYPGLSSFQSSSSPAGGGGGGSANVVGISGAQTAPSGAAPISAKTTVDCVDGDVQDIGEIKFAAGGLTDAEDYCKSTCQEECDISVNTDGDIEHHASQKEKTLLRCDCYCDGTQEGSVFGLIGSHAEEECESKCVTKAIKAEVKDCRNFDVDILQTSKESTILYNDILKDAEILKTSGRQCTCKKVGDDTDNYIVYGTNDGFAMHMCGGGGYGVNVADCSDFQDNMLFYKENDIKNTHQQGSPKYKCEKSVKTVRCRVNDFKLPQKVGDVQTYIINYGDPKFIYYWNMFPIEENTWTFEPDWKVHALIAAVSIFPPSKVAGAGFKMGWGAIKTGSKNLVSRTLTKLGLKGGQLTLPGMKAAVSKVGGKVFSWQLMKEQLIDIASKRLTARGAKRVAIKGAMLEIAYHAAILADSMSEKYEPQGNNMVLKSPFENAETLSLESGWENKPVLVKWDKKPTFLHKTSLDNAHLVSPCYLKEITVARENIRCKDYTFDFTDRSSTCIDPDIEDPDKDDIECGTFDENIDEYIGEEVYDRMTGLLKLGNKKLFEHEPSGSKTPEDDDIMKITKIYLPHKLLETGELYYISDLELVPGGGEMTAPCIGASYSAMPIHFDKYSAKLYDGSNKVVKSDIEMKCVLSGAQCIIADNAVTEKPFDNLIIVSEGILSGGIYNYQRIGTNNCYEEGKGIVFVDDNDDGDWDTLEASSKYDSVVLSNIDSSGNFKYMGTSERTRELKTGKGCYTPGIVIDLSKTGSELEDNIEATGITGHDNYCVRHLSKTATWITDIGHGISYVGLAAAVIFGGPVATTVLISASSAAVGAASSITADYKEAWP